MEKIIDFIWWVLVIAILPLQGYFIMDCIAKNNFDFNFWFVTIIYIIVCIVFYHILFVNNFVSEICLF